MEQAEGGARCLLRLLFCDAVGIRDIIDQDPKPTAGENRGHYAQDLERTLLCPSTLYVHNMLENASHTRCYYSKDLGGRQGSDGFILVWVPELRAQKRPA